MIKRAYEKSELVLKGDYYSDKIQAGFDAYGMGYDFCRFYTINEGLASGTIHLYNSNAVLSGNLIENDELTSFIHMTSPLTVELPRKTAVHLKIDGYKPVKRLLFSMTPDPDFDDEKVKEELTNPVSLQQMFIILNSCFEGLSYDLWYVDMSHKIRHEVSRAFMYKSCTCAAIEMCINSRAFISCVATMPQEQKKGYAGNLLKYIASMLNRNNIDGYLWCVEGLGNFYRGLGFKLVDDDIMLIKSNERK